MDANKEKLKGAAEEIKGKVKGGIGNAFDNEQMEAEGKADQLKGQARQDAAKSAEQLKGAGEQLKGGLKRAVGDIADDPQMEAEGRVDQLKGQTRQKANE